MLSSARCSLQRQTTRYVRLASSVASSASISRSIVARPGRNLTDRYRRLENRIRGKSALSKQVSALSLGSDSAAHPPLSNTSHSPRTIAGFVIPEEPRPPADDECCMSGCAICVYDLYEESLAAYKESVATLRSALSVLDIPEHQWPAHIRSTRETGAPGATAAPSAKAKDAVLSAFEEMERALKEKREQRAMVEAEKRARGEVLEGDGEKVGLDLRSLYEGVRWMIFPNR